MPPAVTASRFVRHCVPAAVGLLALAALAPAAASSAPSPRTYYVDCARNTSGDGSSARPFADLAAINDQELRPGDAVRFRRGTHCIGTFRPQDSGTARHWISVGAYGSGAAPVIDGHGAAAAILLHNVEYWTVADLAVINDADPGTARRGIEVELSDYGTGHGYDLHDLDVHDVAGDDSKDVNGSAGIQFQSVGSTTPSAFDDVRIEHNAVRHVDREGIFIASSWSNRAAVGTTSGPAWTPSTRVHIADNHLSDIGGDGIVVTTTNGAVVEHNVLAGFHIRSPSYNAGMWPYNADNTVFQLNDTSGGQTTLDGMAYDIDEGTNNTVFQYNFSHDNAGGAFLVCNADGTVDHALIRYNISQHDAYRGVETCSGPLGDVAIHHNVFYVGAGNTQTVLNQNTDSSKRITFADNIVDAAGGTATFTVRSADTVFDGNLYSGVVIHPADAHALSGDPRFFAPGLATSRDTAWGYLLRRGSPALGSAVPVTSAGTRDYFGLPLAFWRNRGAYQGPGL